MLELVLLAKAAAAQTPAAPPLPEPPDVCALLVPPRLASKLRAEEPGFELPKAADAGQARLQTLAQTGGWPCPFVVLGDFDGNGWLDRVVLLKNPAPAPGTATGRLVAALNTEGSWQLKLAEDWGLPLQESFVHAMEPGLYQRSDASSTPAAELDLLQTIQSDVPGFAAGKLNERHAVYFFQDGVWQRLWMRN